MTAFDVLAAVDAVVTDLQAQAGALGLPAFAVQKYVQPLWVSAEMGQPLLAVYAKGTDPTPLTTSGEYVDRHLLTIGWFVPVPASLTDGIVDNAVARVILAQGQALYKYAQGAYFAGIPGLSAESEVTVKKVRFGAPQGGVYGIEIDLVVGDFA